MKTFISFATPTHLIGMLLTDNVPSPVTFELTVSELPGGTVAPLSCQKIAITSLFLLV